MLYFLAQYLDSIDLPGAGLWTYVSFRSLMALMLSLVISMWMGKSFITYMKKKRHLEKARDAEIDPYGVKKIGVPSMGGIVIITDINVPAVLGCCNHFFLISITLTSCELLDVSHSECNHWNIKALTKFKQHTAQLCQLSCSQ